MEKRSGSSRTYKVNVRYKLEGANAPAETVMVKPNQTYRQANSYLNSMQDIWQNTSVEIERTRAFLRIQSDYIQIDLWFEQER